MQGGDFRRLATWHPDTRSGRAFRKRTEGLSRDGRNRQTAGFPTVNYYYGNGAAVLPVGRKTDTSRLIPTEWEG